MTASIKQHVLSFSLIGSLLVLSGAASVASAADDEATNLRIVPVAKVKLVGAPAGGAKSRSGEELYNAACMACHATGAAGAPKVGDNAAWAPRIKLGLDGLVKSATAGKNAMPPKGGSDASEVELARAIAYMANKSGASFAAPK